MHKQKFLAVIAISIILVSCSSKKETPASIAQKWCELNAKMHKATGAAEDAAEEALENFERRIGIKYRDDTAFVRKMNREIERCEDASEGRD